ncbi:glycosyltransferase family 2 protein [Rickettsiales endosymbiont of Stachyamoeba lipophora]|uniref:glycosyltransferase family 2 protein n=1 Tax=Rickettsiales endosymbiont of Stachyamoeba lipophora TaxID=2486578 RepID=UPI000F655704|nr:glycosyltransferase family 2 protein [Rickettsiales endosymbiont of Stachyamoeba lipophora]AZL15749.1 glycosyltransferase [Rickettsiales endosymbiont of Stachyamoeba lipophora]
MLELKLKDLSKLYNLLSSKSFFSLEKFNDIVANHTLEKSVNLNYLVSNDLLNKEDYIELAGKQANYSFSLNIKHDHNLLSNFFSTEDYISHSFLCFNYHDSFIIYLSDFNDELEEKCNQNFSNYQIYLTDRQLINQFIVNYLVKDDENIRQILPISQNLSAKKLANFSYLKLSMVVALINTLGVTFLPNWLEYLLLFFGILYLAENSLKLITVLSGLGGYILNRFQPKYEIFDYPVYTLLVPLFKEANIIKQLIDSILQLNYPKHKLDVIFLLEEGDELTINECKKYVPSFFNILILPESLPKTKPKALNFGLVFAKGEFVTIYDAEDIPDPDQLRKAVSKFSRSSKRVACLQARLNYYNYDHNLLTKFFAIEYSIWFDLLIPGLSALKLPVPLGGTSNHFRTEVLKKIGGWDSYNVTEDADLGIRLARSGYKTKIIDSKTLEEAVSVVPNWLGQRSRWTKGYYQTFLVHFLEPLKLLKAIKFKSFVSFMIFVGIQPLLFLINPLIVVIGGYNSITNKHFTLTCLPSICLINLTLMVTLPILFASIVIIKNKWFKLLPIMVIYPFYFILHSIAAYKAVRGLISKPFYWYKTKHGS